MRPFVILTGMNVVNGIEESHEITRLRLLLCPWVRDDKIFCPANITQEVANKC